MAFSPITGNDDDAIASFLTLSIACRPAGEEMQQSTEKCTYTEIVVTNQGLNQYRKKESSQ
jgi:hypothetical protein